MTLFKPRNYGNIAGDDGPSLPHYSISSYGQFTTSSNPKSESGTPHVISYPRKYNFERSLNFDDNGFSLEPELPIYSGSFLLQQQFQSADDKSELFTSYSRKFAERKNEEASKEKVKIPVFSYRSRYDLFDGPSTFNSDSDGFEQPKRSVNVTNYRNITKEKKQPTIEPLIPIRRYQREKKAYTLNANQNVSSNFDICKYGIAKPPSKEDEINRIKAEQFAQKTKVNRVYPDILMADNVGGDGPKGRGKADDIYGFSSSSSSSPVADKSGSSNNNSKNSQFIPASSNYVPKGDQKPMFSQFKSDVFAKYAERKMNEQNNNQSREQANKYHLDSDSDAFLFDSSPRSIEKSVSKAQRSSTTSSTKDEPLYISSLNGQQNQGVIPCKAKEDYERRKAQIDEEDLISQSDMEESNAKNNNNNASSTKHIDDLLNSKEPDNIMARLEQFKKTMEESKKSTQYYGEAIARHSVNVSDNVENQNSLLSESESADTSKIQDDMLSEPSLIFEEKA